MRKAFPKSIDDDVISWQAYERTGNFANAMVVSAVTRAPISKIVASEGSLRLAGAQEAEHTREYVSIPSTAEAQNAGRSKF